MQWERGRTFCQIYSEESEKENMYINHTHMHSGNNNFKKKCMQNMITVRLHHLCKDVHKLLVILLNACCGISS